MAVSHCATTTKRSICAAASSCVRLLVITAITLTLTNCNTCVESAVNAYELQAFADLLAQQHIKHAIVAYNSETQQSLQQEDALGSLSHMTALRFYNVHQAVNFKNFTDFEQLFYYDSPRVGIYLTQLEDVLLQEHVLGADMITPTESDEAGDFGVRVHVGGRFNNSQAWFVMSNERSVDAALANVRRVMTPITLNISADITIGVWMDTNYTLQLFDIYKVQPDWLEIEAKGYWSVIYGLRLKKHFRQSFVRRRRNFKGLQMRAGIVIREKLENMDDLDFLNSLDYKKLDPMQRKSYQLMKLIEPMFNVRFEAIPTKIWGSQWPNGSWDGIMSMLVSGEAEVSLCPMRFVSNRMRLIHYTTAVHSECLFFLFRHPRRNDISNIFFAPFVEEVWYTIVTVIVLTALLLLLQLRHENRFLLNNDPHFEYRLDYAVISILEAFFMQGPAHNAFAATSTRTLVFFVCLFSLLLQQFYGAFIVGSLLAISPRTITNLEALYNSSLELGMENIPYNFDIFENNALPLAKELYTQRICKNTEKHVLSIEEGADRIRLGNFAFHVDDRIYILLKETLTEKEFCDLQEVSVIPPLHIGIGIAKNSPFREYFTTSVLKLLTTGNMQHLANQWQTPAMDCSLSQNREVEVDLQHFLPALLLLGSAMILSVGVLFLEVVHYNLEHGLKLARFCPSILSDPKIEFTN